MRLLVPLVVGVFAMSIAGLIFAGSMGHWQAFAWALIVGVTGFEWLHQRKLGPVQRKVADRMIAGPLFLVLAVAGPAIEALERWLSW